MRNFFKTLRDVWIRFFNIPEVGQLRVAKRRMVLDINGWVLSDILAGRSDDVNLFIESGDAFTLIHKTKCLTGFGGAQYDAYHVVLSNGKISRTSSYSISKHSRIVE